MIFKILKNDFKRKKVITIAVFIFIMLSAILISSGTSMFIDLSNSLDYLFETADVPHFVQYNTGVIDKDAIAKWTDENEMVKKQQNGEMINIDGSNIFIGSSLESEAGTVMEMAFTQQHESFDFLLNLKNELIRVDYREIAVPIYYMQKYDLVHGDTIKIKNKDTELIFTITDFVRDAQMNPSVISSKRFVVSYADYQLLKNGFGEVEHLISFKLNDVDNVVKFADSYKSSSLPQKGPAVDVELFRILNSLTDGLIAGVIIFIALLLNLISLLCIRFTILATIEEDYKEIGVMKAIGIKQSMIRKIYMFKYFFIAFTATLAGFIISLFMNRFFSADILLYAGSAPKSAVQNLLPFFAAGVIFATIILFTRAVLRKFNKISVIEAIRLGNNGETYRSTKALSLYRTKRINANIFIGLRDVLLRFKSYALLFIVFVVCTFIIIVPLNLLNTMESPDIVKYMGMGNCDIIIDLRQSDEIEQRYSELVDYVSKDKDTIKYSPLVTCTYKIIINEGHEEGLLVETGDLSIFPMEYIKGVMPKLDNEIALSYLVASELEKQIGDEMQLKVDNSFKTMIVSGIYQDITNGGRTAKANIPPNYETAAWYILNIAVKEDVAVKINEYKNEFSDAKVVDLHGYFFQTFGNTISQLKLLNLVAVAISVLVTILITSLFLKMLIAKEMSQIAIMKSIGISIKNIQTQYVTKSLVVLNAGIILGTIISNLVGQALISLVLSFGGASQFEFVINPLKAYLLNPSILIIVVIITTLLSIKSIKSYTVSSINAE